TYNESGTLAYSFIDSLVAMHPYYIARAVGGLFFLIGAVIGAYNIWMTIRTAPEGAAAKVSERPDPVLAGGVPPDVPANVPALQPGE
ncbi:MAG: hypothetical protein KF697_01470, partial [Pseudolabrys sp.]|nr:hypothetical protein [Pseudolabrys sp.]